MPSDMADVGTDAFEQELTLDLMGNEKEVLEQSKPPWNGSSLAVTAGARRAAAGLPRLAWTRFPTRHFV